MVEVTAKVNEDGDKTTVTYDLPDSLEDLVERFGEQVIVNQAKANITIGLQNFIRSTSRPDKDGNVKTDEEVQAAVTAWMPGTRAPAKSKTEKAKELFAALTPEQRAELLAELGGGEDD